VRWHYAEHMQEIAPGLWHWTARHDHIDAQVSAYYLQPERVVLDPILPAEGIEWFGEHGAPEHAVLTNRHHDRHAWRLQQAFGCEVHCIRNGLQELEGRGAVTPFDFGDELPGGIVVHEIGAICPDETAMYLTPYRALACADGVVKWGGAEELTFVPDRLMDEPALTKRRLRDAYRRLVGLDFELLLLAHGDPVTAGAHQALTRFVG
jgi:hypothetical protein